MPIEWWPYIWLVVIVVTAVVEFLTVSMISIWATAGAVVGLILSLFSVDPIIQVITAGIVTIVTLLSLRKIVLKKIVNRSNSTVGLEFLEGKTLTLLTPVTKTELGTAKVNGVVWSIASQNGEEIEQGAVVTPVSISGNVITVKK